MKTACGTPEYLSPELVAILSRRSTSKTYTPKVDIWAVGVILYVMLCGFHPFYSDNQLKLYMAILNGDFQFPSPYWDGIQQSTRDFIMLLLQVSCQPSTLLLERKGLDLALPVVLRLIMICFAPFSGVRNCFVPPPTFGDPSLISALVCRECRPSQRRDRLPASACSIPGFLTSRHSTVTFR